MMHNMMLLFNLCVSHRELVQAAIFLLVSLLHPPFLSIAFSFNYISACKSKAPGHFTLRCLILRLCPFRESGIGLCYIGLFVFFSNTKLTVDSRDHYSFWGIARTKTYVIQLIYHALTNDNSHHISDQCRSSYFSTWKNSCAFFTDTVIKSKRHTPHSAIRRFRIRSALTRKYEVDLDILASNGFSRAMYNI